MTIPTTVSSGTALGNGATYTFSYNFVPDSAANIVVIYTNAQGFETTLSPTQYTITIPSPSNGQLWADSFTITYPLTGSPIANGTSLTASRIIPLLQTTDLSNQGNQWPSAVEEAIDTTVMQLQQVDASLGRSIQFPIVDPLTINPVLPPAAQRASQFCGFDGNGNVIAALPSGSVPISSAMQPVVEASTTSIATSLLGYTPLGTGAVLTNITSELQKGFLHLLDFGAKGDGSTDDTAAIQAWWSACASTGLTGWFDPSPTRGAGYLISSSINYSGSNPMSIMGSGFIFGSYLKLSSLTQNGLYFDCTGRVSLSNFGIVSSGTATSGAAIYVDGTALQSVGWTLDNMILGFAFDTPYNGLYSTGVGSWSITRSSFSTSNYGAYFSTMGDSYFSGNLISPQASGGIGLFLTGDPGGARIVNNKWNSGTAYAAAIGVVDAYSDGDLLIQNNSIESYSANGVSVGQSSMTDYTFGNIIVTGNEFSAGATSSARAVEITSAGSGGYSSVIIGDNTMGGAQHGILVGNTQYVNIHDNQCNDIDINSSTTNGTVHDNTIYSGGQINNQSTSVIVINNPGFNPVGASALSPGSSPWTYTAGASPECLFLSDSSAITALTVNGTSVLPHATGANVVLTVPLPPFGVAIITNSGTLTGKKMIY